MEELPKTSSAYMDDYFAPDREERYSWCWRCLITRHLPPTSWCPVCGEMLYNLTTLEE